MRTPWHKTLPEHFFNCALEASSDAHNSAKVVADSRKGAYSAIALTTEPTRGHSTPLELDTNQERREGESLL
jgi:hypothetical protein